MPRPRGRPRSFDPERALDRAGELFWTRGFAATSLDDLSTAMGIARPSLYAAFGDKESLYLAAAARFRAAMAELYVRAIQASTTARDTVLAFFDGAIDRYTSGEIARGCLGVCTATVEAPSHPEVRKMLSGLLEDLDRAFAGTLSRARERGELPAEADIDALTALLSATLHSVAIRARAGTAKPVLDRLARASVDLLLPPPPKPRRKR